MYETIFLKKAILEIEDAGVWYSNQQENLNKKFEVNIFAAIEKLQSDKIIHGAVYHGLSRVFVKRFPYIIYFKKDIARQQIIICGVLHSKQSRSLLDKRL